MIVPDSKPPVLWVSVGAVLLAGLVIVTRSRTGTRSRTAVRESYELKTEEVSPET